MSSAGGAAGVQPATRRRWQQGAVAGAVAAVLLLAAAAAAVRRPPLAGIALRTAAPAEPPACTADDLNGLLKDGELSWGTWEALYNESSSSGSGAVPPPWRPPWLQAKRCMLRRFTPETARKCLSGRPLVMIGDSVTRYQYLTLLYFLEFGKWPAPLLGGAGAPSPVIEREWGGWTQFYKGTTEPFGEHQQCRCFRDGAWDIREDRFYNSGTISASFFMWMGFPLKPLTGLWGFPPFSNATQCAPGECNAEPDWQMPLDEAISKVVAQLKPHTLVFNSGLWRTMGKDPAWPRDVYDRIFEAANAAVAPQGGRCIWKTTTYGQMHHVGRDRDFVSVVAARRHGWQLMDAWAATRAAKLQLPDDPFVDTVHFLGFIYAELNQLMLNMICPVEGTPPAATSRKSAA